MAFPLFWDLEQGSRCRVPWSGTKINNFSKPYRKDSYNSSFCVVHKETLNFGYISRQHRGSVQERPCFGPLRPALGPVVCGNKMLYIVSELNGLIWIFLIGKSPKRVNELGRDQCQMLSFNSGYTGPPIWMWRGFSVQLFSCINNVTGDRCFMAVVMNI